MAYGTVNADTLVTSTSGGILGAGDASIMKNRIINGAMTVAQYGTGSTTVTTNGYFSCDRWKQVTSASSKYAVTQSSAAPSGFSNSLQITSASAYSVTAGDFFGIIQRIEGFNTYDLAWGTASAKTVTFSFWVQSSLTGTFGGAITNSAESYSYPFLYTISAANTWTQISVTIAGPTTGTWVGATNGIGMEVWFGLGVGSTYSGTAGSWSANQYFSATGATSVVGTSGATFYITGVQLEVGSSATGFEYVNYQTSLANCQRYCMKYGGNSAYEYVCWVNAASTTVTEGFVTTPVSMRAIPTATWASLKVFDNVSVSSVPSSLTVSSTESGLQQVAIYPTGLSGLTQYRQYALGGNNSTSAYLILSAEL